MRVSSLVISALFAAGALGVRSQTVPATLNYQGRLTDNAPQQVPVTGAVMMAFAIYEAPTGGAPLWREPAAGGISIEVTDGVFSVTLGAIVPIPDGLFTGATSVRHLEIIVNPGASQEILAPRQRFSAAGYANLAQRANTAVSAVTSADSTALGGQPAADWQRRVAACGAGQAIRQVNADGSVVCASFQPAVLHYKVNATRTLISSTSFTQVTGLSQTVTFAGPATVHLETYGSLETTSTSFGGSGCILQLFQNGVAVADAFQTLDVRDATGFSGTMGAWRFSTLLNLSAGSYTFTVRARKYAFDNFYAGGNTTAPNPNEGNLIIRVYPQ